MYTFICVYIYIYVRIVSCSDSQRTNHIYTMICRCVLCKPVPSASKSQPNTWSDQLHAVNISCLPTEIVLLQRGVSSYPHHWLFLSSFHHWVILRSKLPSLHVYTEAYTAFTHTSHFAHTKTSKTLTNLFTTTRCHSHKLPSKTGLELASAVNVSKVYIYVYLPYEHIRRIELAREECGLLGWGVLILQTIHYCSFHFIYTKYFSKSIRQSNINYCFRCYFIETINTWYIFVSSRYC